MVENVKQMGENDMGDYNSRTNIDDFLTVRGFGGGYGYGGGYGGGGGGGSLYTGNNVLAAEAHANGTALKEAVDCNSRQFLSGLDRVSDQAEETRRLMSFESVNKNITDSEFRGLDRQRDLERILNQNSKDAAECCCDTQKAIAEAAKDAAKCCCDAQLEAQKNACDTQRLVSSEASATRSLILEVEGRANLDKLAEARAENIFLRTAALDNKHR